MTEPFQMKVEKPWGYELILTPPESKVVGKILHVNAGCRLSLQYHDQKEETIALLSGEGVLLLENKKISMETRKGYLIKPFQKHRLIAKTECEFMEASTEEKGKTVRLEDDYSRPDEILNH